MAERKRKNKTPAWVKELEDVLECPVCCETFKDPPIYLCENMHGMCSKCKTSLMQNKKQAKCCPICRGKLTGKRNYHLEKILEKLPKEKCKHGDCDFKRSEKALVTEHEAECQQRPVSCGMCENQIAVSKLTRHLVKEHTNDPKEDMTVDCDLPITLESIPIHANMYRIINVEGITGCQFYLNEARFDDDNMMVYVSCSLSPAKAEDYKYTITLDGSKNTFSGSRRCVSCDASHTKVRKSKNAVMWDEELIREAKSHLYKLRITKC